ncbi:MAG: hypothetical protein V4714_23075 [Bacteroidota bacterium]
MESYLTNQPPAIYTVHIDINGWGLIKERITYWFHVKLHSLHQSTPSFPFLFSQPGNLRQPGFIMMIHLPAMTDLLCTNYQYYLPFIHLLA